MDTPFDKDCKAFLVENPFSVWGIDTQFVEQVSSTYLPARPTNCGC